MMMLMINNKQWVVAGEGCSSHNAKRLRNSELHRRENLINNITVTPEVGISNPHNYSSYQGPVVVEGRVHSSVLHQTLDWDSIVYDDFIYIFNNTSSVDRVR